MRKFIFLFIMALMGIMFAVGCVTDQSGSNTADIGGQTNDISDPTNDVSDPTGDVTADTVYNIVYNNTKGVSNIVPKTFTAKDTIVLSDLTTDGYTFCGWFDASTDGTQVTGWNAGDHTADVILWARWTANCYTITLWNDGDQSGDTTIDVTYDMTLPSITVPTKIGFIFKGYFTEKGGQGIKYIDDKGAGCKTWDIAENKTLFAYFLEKGKYAIEYLNTKGAANITPREFKESDNVSLPTISADGYTFCGWFDASTDGTQVIGWNAGDHTADVVLWARWTANHYTVTLNNGAGIEDTTIDVIYDTVVPSITKPTKTGYTFCGYFLDNTNDENKKYIDANGIGCKVWSIPNNATLYAKWTVIQYNITYAGIEGAMNPNTVTKYTIEDKIELDDAEKVGYTFNGWHNGSTIMSRIKDSTGDITLTAQWTVNKYTLTLNNGAGIQDTTIDVTFDTIVPNIIKPTKTYYTFGGYFLDNTNDENKKYIDKNGNGIKVWDISNNTTLYVKWIRQTYTVIFNSNDSRDLTSCQTINWGEETALTMLPDSYNKAHWAFYKWYDHPYGIGDGYDNGAAVADLTGDGGVITLYAQWNMKIGNDICLKTGMQQVLSESTIIICDRNDGSNKSVFPSVRGSVTLGKYAIGKYPVTQELYYAVMDNNPSVNTVTNDVPLQYEETTDDLRPVDSVNWYDAVVFCNKLSQLMGKTRCYKLKDLSFPDEKIASIPTNDESNVANWYDMTCDWTANGYRLPTECEWECAARGGVYSNNTSDPWNYLYSGSNNIDDVAWYVSDASSPDCGRTFEVGLKAANTIGLYDMSGNIQEFCWDNNSEDPISASTPVTGPTTGLYNDRYRQIRGGDTFCTSNLCKVFNRRSSSAYVRSSLLSITGIRLACNSVE